MKGANGKNARESVRQAFLNIQKLNFFLHSIGLLKCSLSENKAPSQLILACKLKTNRPGPVTTSSQLTSPAYFRYSL